MSSSIVGRRVRVERVDELEAAKVTWWSRVWAVDGAVDDWELVLLDSTSWVRVDSRFRG